jgi:hypothetical protein
VDRGAHVVLKRALLFVFAFAFAFACAKSQVPIDIPFDTSGPTVLVFFSSHCPCVAAHDARLVALANEFMPRGVHFLALDSEVDADEARDRIEATSRHYPFPIAIDREARIARAVGAEYATFSVVVDEHGKIVFRGGIDSDRTHLKPDATPYLHDALDDVLARRPLRRTTANTLGCALRTW